jgi:hypothetical protein
MDGHRPVQAKGPGRRVICAECQVTWPCRAKHESLMRCPQCGRPRTPKPGQARCAECISASMLLTHHWRKLGLYIRPNARRGARYAAPEVPPAV